MKLSLKNSMLYEKFLKNITKNRLIIYLILFLEKTQIIYEAIRMSGLLLNESYEETTENLNYYLGMISLNKILNNQFLKAALEKYVQN